MRIEMNMKVAGDARRLLTIAMRRTAPPPGQEKAYECMGSLVDLPSRAR